MQPGMLLPEHDAHFVAAMLTCFVPENIPADLRHLLPENEWPKVRANFAQGLTVAADCLRRQQEARWQN